MANQYEEALLKIDRELRAGRISIEDALCSAVELGEEHCGALECATGPELREAMDFSLKKYLEKVKTK